jgi:hypothetical protein
MDFIDDILNLTYLGKSNISLAKAILLFYLIIANNHTKELFSGQFTNFIEDNRYAQHVIGFITMMVMLNIAGGINDAKKNLLYTSLAYGWFTMTTKLDLHWNLLIIALLFSGLIYEFGLVDKEIKSLDDESLEEIDIAKIKKKHNRMKTGIIIAIIFVTLIGTFTYYNKKKVQYGGNFDPMKFIFSKSKIYKLRKVK